jgi:hypothetical protein
MTPSRLPLASTFPSVESVMPQIPLVRARNWANDRPLFTSHRPIVPSWPALAKSRASALSATFSMMAGCARTSSTGVRSVTRHSHTSPADAPAAMTAPSPLSVTQTGKLNASAKTASERCAPAS